MARLGGGKGERTGRGDVGASGDALSGVAVLFITTITTTRYKNKYGLIYGKLEEEGSYSIIILIFLQVHGHGWDDWDPLASLPQHPPHMVREHRASH